MKSLQHILEGILDKNPGIDIPKEVIKAVKICRPLKFIEHQKWGAKIVYINKPGSKSRAVKSFETLSELFKKLPVVQLKQYINDSNVTLVGVSERGISIGVPGTTDMIHVSLNDMSKTDSDPDMNMMVSVFTSGSASERLEWTDSNSFSRVKYDWYMMPAECFGMIKDALFK